MSVIKHTPGQLEAVREAIAGMLGDTYDCTRVWSAWSVGTMGPGDFVPVAEDDDRLQELAVAAIDASGAPELLEALQEVLLAYELTLKSAYCQVDPDDDVIAKANAAIVKATGV